jgi:hypothetical protein
VREGRGLLWLGVGLLDSCLSLFTIVLMAFWISLLDFMYDGVLRLRRSADRATGQILAIARGANASRSIDRQGKKHCCHLPA